MDTQTFVGSDGTEFSFSSEDALFESILAEAEYWSWLQPLSNTAPTSQIWKPLFRPLMTARDAAKDGTRPAADRVAACADGYRKFLELRPALHRRSEARAFVEMLATRSKVEAVYALATLFQLEGKIPPSDLGGKASDSVVGITEAVLFFRLGLTPTIEALRERAGASVASLAQSAEIALEHATEVEHARTLAGEIIGAQEKRFSTLHQELDTAGKDLFAQMSRDVAMNRSKLESEWQRITDAYDSQMALRAPASYWKTKKRSHTKWVFIVGLLTLGVALGGGWLMFEVAWQIFGNRPVLQLPSWYQVLSFSIAAIIYLWTIRSLLRFTLSHVHLALDAAERYTMIVSYLALIRKKDLPEGLLDKVFSAIFRPTGDGIVKEEGIPWPSIVDAIKSRG